MGGKGGDNEIKIEVSIMVASLVAFSLCASEPASSSSIGGGGEDWNGRVVIVLCSVCALVVRVV